jgi:hypothetical protein
VADLRRPRTDSSLPLATDRTLEAAGVLTAPSAGWNLEDFVETRVAKLQ